MKIRNMPSKSKPQTTYYGLNHLSIVSIVAALVILVALSWQEPLVLKTVDHREHNDEILPFCNLDSSLMERATWVDPLDNSNNNNNQTRSRSILKHPTSHTMDQILEYQMGRDGPDAERMRRVARLELDTHQSSCQLQEWSARKFETCLGVRRLLFIGDSMSMQQAESLIYLFDVKDQLIKEDRSDEKHQKGKCRHCMDVETDTGLHIVGRAIFYSDEVDGTPMKFNKNAWDIMVQDLGGWKARDILVVNFGGHYMADLMTLRQDLAILFRQVLAKMPPDVDVIWRDYEPTHFRSFAPDGEYPPSHFVKLPQERACVPHVQSNAVSTVKNAVYEILNECGAPCERIRTLDAWELLRDAFDQHSEGSHCYDDTWCDCRHYLIPGPIEFVNLILFNMLCNDAVKNDS